MASPGESSHDIFDQLNNIFHEPEDSEREDKNCYHDADFLRGILEKERELLSKVVLENVDLLDAIEKQKIEAFTIQEVQSKEIHEKKQRIEELERQVQQKDQQYKQLEIDSALVLFEECQKLKIKNNHLEDTLGKRVEELEQIIAGVQEFRERQEEVEKRMLDAEEYAAKTKLETERILPDLERNFIEKCSAHEKEFERKLEELKIALTATVEERLSERTKNILADNEQLLEDLKIHMGATSGLTKQRDELQAETSSLASEIGILKEAGDLHVQRGIAQARIVEQHQSKLLILERSLRQVIRQYSAERAETEKLHQQVVANLTSEIQALKSSVAGKAKDIKRLRRLTDQMISQRAEVETFLIESLDYVRCRLATERGEDGAGRRLSKRERDDQSSLLDGGSDASSSSTTRLPSIRSTSHSWPGARTDRSCYVRSSRTVRGFETARGRCLHHDLGLHVHQALEEVDVPEDADSGLGEELGFCPGGDAMPKLVPKVDISDLSWTDREKVLRYLFQKITRSRIGGRVPTVDCRRTISLPSARGSAGGMTAPYTISEAGRLLA